MVSAWPPQPQAAMLGFVEPPGEAVAGATYFEGALDGIGLALGLGEQGVGRLTVGGDLGGDKRPEADGVDSNQIAKNALDAVGPQAAMQFLELSEPPCINLDARFIFLHGELIW